MRSVWALLLLLFLSPLSAFAQEGGPPLPTAPEDDKPPAPRPTAPDTRSGHPTIALHDGLLRLAGSAEQGRSHANILGWGHAPGFQLAYPFRRDLAVELWGSFASFGAASGCSGCKGTSLAAGLGAVYHIIDGTPFDPWLSAGIGLRQTTLLAPAFNQLEYSGLSLVRLALGGDYFFTPAIGVGPFLEFTLGRYLSRSPGPLDEEATHTSFGTGFRIVLSPF